MRSLRIARSAVLLGSLLIAGCAAWPEPEVDLTDLSPEARAAWQACPEDRRKVIHTSFDDARGVRRTYYRLTCTADDAAA